MKVFYKGYSGKLKKNTNVKFLSIYLTLFHFRIIHHLASGHQLCLWSFPYEKPRHQDATTLHPDPKLRHASIPHLVRILHSE